jgi:hypothetical protein
MEIYFQSSCLAELYKDDFLVAMQKLIALEGRV